MKTVLTWLGWFLVIMMFKVANMADVPFSISGPVILGPIFLWIIGSSVLKKKASANDV